MVGYDVITQEGLKVILQRGEVADVVGLAEDVKALPDQLEATKPDVVITNIRHSGEVDAVEVVKTTRKYKAGLPVIVLTESENDPWALNAVMAGISAYLLKKNANAEALGAVIDSVIKAGATVISAPLMQTVLASLSGSGNEALGQVTGNFPADLTNRELEVLKYLAVGENNGAISSALNISHETTRKHVSRVVEKLGARNRTHAAILAARAGITGVSGPVTTTEMMRVSNGTSHEDVPER